MLIWSDGIALSVFYAGKEALAVLGKQSVRGFVNGQEIGFCGEDIYSFTKGNPKEVVTDPEIIEKQCALIDRVHEMGGEVLLSCHPGIQMNTKQVVELALYYSYAKGIRNRPWLMAAACVAPAFSLLCYYTPIKKIYFPSIAIKSASNI